jgi:hypothetical protein
MCTTKYNNLKTKYKFTEAEIIENPEKISTPEMYLEFDDEDARAFA